MITIKITLEKAHILSAVICQWLEDYYYSHGGNWTDYCSFADVKFLENLSDTITSVSVDRNFDYVVYKDL